MERSNTYRNISYTVTITLNAVVEKQINGKRIHIVTCSAEKVGDKTYYKQYEAETPTMEDVILKAESEFVQWVDTTSSKEELLLLKLGFIHK